MKAPFILLTLFTASVHGQTVIGDLFGGSNGVNPTTLTASTLVGVGASETDTIGPGWDSTVGFGVGVVYGITMGINEGNNGEYRLSGAGVAGVLGNFESSKTFGAGALGTPFVGGELYALELQVESAAMLSLLGSYTIGLAIDGVGVSDSTGQGLLGIADVLTLFGGNDTATLLFRAPETINAQSLTVSIDGQTVAGLLGSELTFTSGSIYAVPEPGVTTLAGVFAVGMLVRRKRR